jgi:hypothetical protein
MYPAQRDAASALATAHAAPRTAAARIAAARIAAARIAAARIAAARIAAARDLNPPTEARPPHAQSVFRALYVTIPPVRRAAVETLGHFSARIPYGSTYSLRQRRR